MPRAGAFRAGVIAERPDSERKETTLPYTRNEEGRDVSPIQTLRTRWLERDPSTLFVGVERYRTLRPELFNLTALPDPGPLLRQTPQGAI